MYQQLFISDLNPHAKEFVSMEELWFEIKQQMFIWNNSWIFDDEEEEDVKDTQSEVQGAITPPVMLQDFDINDEESEEFYDCIQV